MAHRRSQDRPLGVVVVSSRYRPRAATRIALFSRACCANHVLRHRHDRQARAEPPRGRDSHRRASISERMRSRSSSQRALRRQRNAIERSTLATQAATCPRPRIRETRTHRIVPSIRAAENTLHRSTRRTPPIPIAGARPPHFVECQVRASGLVTGPGRRFRAGPDFRRPRRVRSRRSPRRYAISFA